jgi:hypothetical protein
VETFVTWPFYGYGTYLQTRQSFPEGLLDCDRDLKFVEYDFTVVDDISISKWNDHG